MRKAKRLLATLMAFAMLVTMIPVMPTAAEAAGLEDHVIPADSYDQHPEGITVDLFDYWLTGQNDADNVEYNQNSAHATSGINKDHILKFGKGMGDSADLQNINYWTRSAQPFTGIVSDTLTDGYPELEYETATRKGEGGSLSYLFDGANGTGKQSYLNVGGLLQQDEEGYFYYNSQDNFAEYDDAAKAFKLYDTWGVIAGGQSPNGQFFPFNTGVDVFEESNGQLDQKAGLNSVNEVINHYFGIHMDTRFQQPKGGKSPSDNTTPVTYSFSGDDDVWIYIDDVLVADLGGIHNATSVYIDFSTGDITVFEDSETGVNSNDQPDRGETIYTETTLKDAFDAAGRTNSTTWNGDTFADETYHTMDFFYLERGNTDSNMRLKFNLVTTPESTLEKVDQDGEPVPDAKYELYQTDNDQEILIATGTTGPDGTFIFRYPDGKTLPLSDLKGTNYVLREVDVPDGYRSAGDIHLRLQQSKSGQDSKLLLSDNAWDTGAYAMAKVRAIANTTPVDGKRMIQDINNINRDIDEGKILVAVFKTDDPNIEYGDSVETCPIVYGDAINGWQFSEKTGIEALQEVAAAMKSDTELEGVYEFKPDSCNRYYADIDNLPGDITEYAWMKDGNGEYTGAYFYTTADTLEEINENNTYQLKANSFTRDFAVTLYAPNIKNKLLVQKVDDKNQTPLAGAEFALYAQDDTDFSDPVDTCVTVAEFQVDDQTVKGAAAMTGEPDGTGIPKGKYYLVETKAPAGYEKNTKKIEVIVDDEGVHVNAGDADDAGDAGDNVKVTLGIGKIVKSMVQFAVDDGIDATLHDIDAQLQTTDDYPENANWSNVSGETMALSYGAASASLEYGPTEADGKTGLTYDAGWGRLNITQDYEATTENNSPKQNLNNQSLNNLFSGTVLVAVGNEKQAPGNIQITKEVESSVESDKEDPFTVKLTITGDGGLSEDLLKIYKDGSETPLEGFNTQDATTTFTIKDGQTISLEVPAGVELKVEEVLPADSVFDVSYKVGDQENVQTVTATEGGEAQTVTITNTREQGSGDEAILKGDTNLSITKNVEGGEWPENAAFEFTIAASDETPNAPLPKDADGNEQSSISITKPTDDNPATASFGDITFTQTGTFKYTISENKGTVENMNYDDHKLTVTVTVGKDATAALEIENVTYTSDVTGDTEEQAKTFTNTIGEEEDNPGGGGDDDTPDLNTEDHFSYIVGYPEDYRTGEATDDESLWPVKPQGNITRAEVATIFYRLLTDEARTENWTRDNDYTDVAADSWYNTPVSTLGAMGIVRGYEDGSFRPDAPITRAEFAAIAVRFFENDNVNYEEGLFTDIAGSEWFADAVAAAQEHGIVGGYPDGSFQPNKAITRAEATSIVNRTVDRIPDADHLLPENEMRVWPDNSDPDIWYYADMQEATSGHDYEWILDDNDEPLCEQWTGDLPEVDWEQVEIDQEEKHGLR